MEKINNFLKAKLQQLYLNEQVRKVFHTFWQAAGGVLLSGLLMARSSTDIKLTAAAAFATGFAALKATYISKRDRNGTLSEDR